MELKPGSRWRSAVCGAEVIVVRPPKSAVDLECGGHPLLPFGETQPAGLEAAPALAGGVAIGKRYQDSETGLEVLVTKAGKGSLSIGGHALRSKEAKPLPSSD